MVCMCMIHRPCWVLAKSYAAGECISLEFARAEARRNALQAEAAAAYTRRAAAAHAERGARIRAETGAAYAANEAFAARRRALLAAVVGGRGERGGGGEGGGGQREVVAAAVELARPAEPTLQAAPSAPPVIAVIARIVPSAQATLVSPGEAALYETADAEMASSAV